MYRFKLTFLCPSRSTLCSRQQNFQLIIELLDRGRFRVQDQKVVAPPSLCVPMMISSKLSRKLQNTNAQGWLLLTLVIPHNFSRSIMRSTFVFSERDIQIAFRCIVMKFDTDFQCSQRMNPNDLGDHDLDFSSRAIEIS